MCPQVGTPVSETGDYSSEPEQEFLKWSFTTPAEGTPKLGTGSGRGFRDEVNPVPHRDPGVRTSLWGNEVTDKRAHLKKFDSRKELKEKVRGLMDTTN